MMLSIEKLATIANLMMVAIWIIYLQLFYLDYRRRNRPFLIIHHAQGNNPSSLCLFVNMSKEPVHIVCVVANIYTSNETISRYVTNYSRLTPEDTNVQTRLREGPIQPGGYLVLGSFENIILGDDINDETNNADERAINNDLTDVHELEICVAVTHGPSKFNIGARRRFIIDHQNGEALVRAFSIHTEQLVRRSKRVTVRQWIEKRLQPKNEGRTQTQQTDQSRKEPR